jgi:hypothetical protein
MAPQQGSRGRRLQVRCVQLQSLQAELLRKAQRAYASCLGRTKRMESTKPMRKQDGVEEEAGFISNQGVKVSFRGRVNLWNL